jgi:hypothetical protein
MMARTENTQAKILLHILAFSLLFL